MPIKVPNDLPAVDILTKENVFVMTDTRAVTQDIRPLQILILNLMPTKIETETQLTRLLGNTPLQVELELLQTSTHKASNVSEEHMIAFYKTFDQIKSRYYDGMIITGAPVELMEFEEVEYWDELCEIMEWSKDHVHSIFYICWGAQAGLYYHYGIKKRQLPKKLSGVYKHSLEYKTGMLFRGFDDEFYVPHSRNTTVDEEAVYSHPELKVISASPEAGIFACKTNDDKHIFIMGHSEYDPDTLQKEYERDVKAGINPEIPCNYFPGDDPSKAPTVIWRSCANLLYSNWLNYFVYQSTPFDLNAISTGETPAHELVTDEFDLIVAKFGGTSLASAEMFGKVKGILSEEPRRRFAVASAPGKRNTDDIKVTDLLIQVAAGVAEQAGAEGAGGMQTGAEQAGGEQAGGEQAHANQEARIEKLGEVKERFAEILNALNEEATKEGKSQLNIDLDAEFRVIEEIVLNGKSEADYDYIVSRGEYLNAKILAAYTGFDFVDAADYMKFDEAGKLDEELTGRLLQEELLKHQKAVVPGFYGSLPDGRIKTFSRGGSDVTGALVSSAVNADMYENWTDVPGLLMADPNVVNKPISVPVITHRELRELSYLGANVMHPDAVFPVVAKGIPIRICDTVNPKEPGTLIVKNARYYESKAEVSGISGKQGLVGITVQKPHLNDNPENREKVLKLFGDKVINLENLIAGIDTLTLIVSEESINNAGGFEHLESEIKAVLKDAEIEKINGISVIGIVGRELGNSPNIAIKILSALAAMHINVKFIDHGTGNMHMTIAVEDKDYENGIKAIYQQFA